MSRAICVVVAVLVVGASAVAFPAPASAPVYRAAYRIPGTAGGTEPRMFVGRDDRRWLITNAIGGNAAVYVSRDKGASWLRTTDPAGQTLASIDVDIVVLPTGRIVANELDFRGINFPTAYSDDGGNTWTRSVGSTELADQDRQWLAVGAKDPTTGHYAVHLVYHNLFTGFAHHNMWVSTSKDSGATFGPPVPITLPGDQAFADLQCADSGGPGSLSVNPSSGRLYAVFGTRSAGPTGGCGATPLEVNIVAATRIWVATSPDNAPGSWTQSLAVDNATSGKIVGMQVSPGALDNKGNMWVVYPESPRPYPDYSGAAIKVVSAPPDLSRWSAPLTVVRGSAAGNLTPHIVAGDPGRLAIAYYKGVFRGSKDPVWYTHVAHVHGAGSTKPAVWDVRLSNVPAYTWTASEMMGACTEPSPLSGVLNGLSCNRATDIWGMALDARCMAGVTWPTVEADAPGTQPGTWVSTQVGGPTLCAKFDAPKRSTRTRHRR